jgi:hypothetical protein
VTVQKTLVVCRQLFDVLLACDGTQRAGFESASAVAVELLALRGQHSGLYKFVWWTDFFSRISGSRGGIFASVARAVGGVDLIRGVA